MVGYNCAFKKAYLVCLFSSALVFSGASSAQFSYDFSGFGTLGYAVSDQPYNYLKYIDDSGTFYRDSILGGQLDLQFSSKLSATIQVQIESDSSDDSGWEASTAWAFLSYRPTNNWLLRGGKLRVPGYLNSQNRDVGVTYDYVRIPAEFDSLSPTYDFTGFSINKTFVLSEGDLSLDAYYGEEGIDWRTYIREDVPGQYSSGSYYNSTNLKVMGAAVTYQTMENTYLGAIHYGINSNDDSNYQWYDEPVYQDLGDGIGYYSFDGATPVDSFEVVIANIGADVQLGYDVRMAVELAGRRVVGDFINGQNGYSGYVSLRKRIGNWTPYIFYSRLKTDGDELDFYQALNNSSVPDYIYGADTINASQKVLADLYQGYDQYSTAIGSSYNISHTSKIKAEVMLTHIGVTSGLVDIPSGTDISNTDICVFSLSYSFVF